MNLNVHDLLIREATLDDSEDISLLVYDLTKKYIADEFSSAGAETLLNSMTPDAIKNYIQSGYKYHVAEMEDQVIGVVAIRDNSHLYHLFVTEDYQYQGIAKQLWQAAVEFCLSNGNNGLFTVNASKYALPIYEKLGFVTLSKTKEKNGIVYIPMQYKI